MKILRLTPTLSICLCLASWAGAATAGPRDELLAEYARAAGLAGPAAFSAKRGEALYQSQEGGGKSDTPSCSTCHSTDPRLPGKSRAGKAIEPVAISTSPGRYADAAKVEKWFKRNCEEVFGRACTPQEKGDWLAYVLAH